MIRSDAVNWSAAIVLSLLFHGLLFFGGTIQTGAESFPVLQMPTITRLNFERPAENTVPVVDEVRPAPEKPAEPVKKTVNKPGPVGPGQASKQHSKPPVVEQDEAPEQKASAAPIQQQKVDAHTEGLWQREREQYLQHLLSHIESFKYYPRAARRRALEGEVQISFILRDDGSYEQLSVEGGHVILEQAARQSLVSALPLPSPPQGIGIDRQVEFVMVYSLQR